MLISTRCIRGFMSSLTEKSWKHSNVKGIKANEYIISIIKKISGFVNSGFVKTCDELVKGFLQREICQIASKQTFGSEWTISM